MFRRCSYCKVRQPLSEFAKDRQRKSGVGWRCRGCAAAYSRLRRARATPEQKAWKLAYNAWRRACRMQATPKWANKKAIRQLYLQAAKWNAKNPGNKVHVDHIIPLKSDYVCGLHCENNLQIIPAVSNISKKNRLNDRH